MRWRQRLFEKRMSRSLDYSWLDHTLFIHFFYLLITFLFYIYIYFSSASKWDKSDEVVQHFVAAKKRGRLLWWNGLSLLWRDCWKLQRRCSYWRRSAALADDSKRCSNHFIQPWFCPDVEYRAHHRRISETHTGFAPAFCDSKDMTSDSFRWPVYKSLLVDSLKISQYTVLQYNMYTIVYDYIIFILYFILYFIIYVFII